MAIKPTPSNFGSKSPNKVGGFGVGGNSSNSGGGFGLSQNEPSIKPGAGSGSASPSSADASTANKSAAAGANSGASSKVAKLASSLDGTGGTSKLSSAALSGFKNKPEDKSRLESTKDAVKDHVKEEAKAAAKKAAKEAVKKVAKQVGKKIASKALTNPWVLLGILALILILAIILLVASIWDSPSNALKVGWTAAKAAVGIGINTTIESGGASRLAYEIPIGKDGHAVAASSITNYNPSLAPMPGTYAYKLSKIDWEKAKYQTITPATKCKVITEKVAAPDGSTRSVISRVEIDERPGSSLEGLAKANCLEKMYPVFNTVLRSSAIRDGVNKELGVRYAYALPTDSKDFDGKTNAQVDTYLRNKTLDRIWKKSGGGVTNFSTKTVEPPTLADLCGAQDRACIAAVFGFGYNAERDQLDSSVVDCANTFDFKGEKSMEKAILKAGRDLECGIPSDRLRFMYELPSEEDIKSTDTAVSNKAKAAAMQSMCEMYTRLQEAQPEAIANYKKVVEDRLASQTNAAIQAITYADTNRARFLNIRELSGDVYKIMGMGASQEYNVAVNQSETGIPTDSGAISRVGGLPNFALNNGKKIYNDRAVQKAQDVIDRLGQNNALCAEAKTKSFFSNFFSSALNGFPNSNNQPTIADKAAQYDAYYPKYKAALATLDTYSKDGNGQVISEADSQDRVTLNDIFLKTILIQSNAATAGNEEGTQNFNRMRIGSLAYKDTISRFLGGTFLTQNQSVAQENQTRSVIAYEDRTRGLLWRLFNKDNPSSITSRVAVAMIDKPDKVVGNIASVLSNLFNPAKNLVGSRTSLAYSLTGQSRVANAATSYEMENLRLDPAGVPDGFSKIDPLKNSNAIEALLLANQGVADVMFNWSACSRENIPTRFHLYNPDASKRDLYVNYCRELYDIDAPTELTDQRITDAIIANPKAVDLKSPAVRSSISFMYRAYQFYNKQADAFVFLSNPDKEDSSLNASSSQPEAIGDTPAQTDTGEIDSSFVGVDTSAQPCTGGSDAGIGDKKGPDGVVQYRIRLCSVSGIIVNTSIARNLESMLAAARADGVNLSASGYRTFERQATLRRQNGCPDNTSPSSSCNTPTAPIGKSMHESGEALDFHNMTRSSTGFKWLSANAARFNFKNLPSEAWHWSPNGR